MRERENLLGRRFGKLVVIGKSNELSKDRRFQWLCKCDCGGTKSVTTGNLKRGYTTSCGCKQNKNSILGRGWSKTRLYRIWKNIKYRTSHTGIGIHHNYRDKGIKMCEEWRNSSEAFILWSLENGYNDKLTIDRKNNDGDYTPENCRWVDNTTQCRNRDVSVYIEYNGEIKHIAEWAKLYGINRYTLYSRICLYHWSIEDALNRPLQK